MYLDLLNKKEREYFLELAQYAMGLNGEHKEEELEVLEGFKYECQMPNYTANKQDKIKEIIKTLKGSSKKAKKIILMELFGILLADGEICDNEAKFIDNISAEFRIKEYEVKRMQRWTEAMNDMFQEGYELVIK